MTPWQRLGAFVAVGPNLPDENLAAFADAGGAWICLLVYGDDKNTPGNLEFIPDLQKKLNPYKISLCGWYNYWGIDGTQFANDVASVRSQYGLNLSILDCEAAVQGNTKMSDVALHCAGRLPKDSIGVSTNSLNDSVVYNGRMDGLAQAQWKSFRQLGIRVSPQWYSSPAYSGCWTDPVCNMEWLSGPNGKSDNLYDAKAKNSRAVPTSYVHPTLEVTGLENADLQKSLDLCVQAQTHEFTKGISLYLLENAPLSDLSLVKQYRSRLYF